MQRTHWIAHSLYDAEFYDFMINRIKRIRGAWWFPGAIALLIKDGIVLTHAFASSVASSHGLTFCATRCVHIGFRQGDRRFSPRVLLVLATMTMSVVYSRWRYGNLRSAFPRISRGNKTCRRVGMRVRAGCAVEAAARVLHNRQSRGIKFLS